MNAHTNLACESALDAINAVEMASERPTRMVSSTFAAWRVLPSGKAQIHLVVGNTLAEVEREIATEDNYGDTFLIRETATISGRAVLHSYRIRRGKWAGRYDPVSANKSYPHHADKLFSVEASFEPVTPWRCVAGADRLGVSGVIEMRS